MNAKSLDLQLKKLTEHEEGYRLGEISPTIQSLPRVSINNKEYIKIDFHLVDNIGIPIFVKRHSRFQDFPLHVHEGVEINYVYSGTCVEIINDSTYTLTKGQALLLDSDTIHTVKPLGENDIIIDICIEKEFLNSNFFNRFSTDSIVTEFFLNAISKGVTHDNFIIFQSQEDNRLELFMKEFLCEWFSPSYSSHDILNSLFSLIISELINVYQKTLTSEADSIMKNSVIPILRYIESNYKTCTLVSVASFFKMNGNYLSNLLKKRTGYSYRELVQQQRIKTAKQLLKNTQLSVSEIANHVGYENISFFYEIFQKQCGCLPGEYRIKNQNS